MEIRYKLGGMFQVFRLYGVALGYVVSYLIDC